MSHKPVTVYGNQTCPYCMAARTLLTRKNVRFDEVPVVKNTASFDDMVEKSGGRRTVPQIFIGDTHVGGFDELNALEQRGELDTLLAD